MVSILNGRKNGLHFSVTIVSFLVTSLFNGLQAQIQSKGGLIYDDYARPSAGADELLRRHGFIATNHVVRTKDGYPLELTHGENPLFQGKNKTKRVGPCKYPILFVHGFASNALSWLVQTANSMPKDFTDVDVEGSSEEQLHLLFGGEPSARAIPLLLLNFACDVWLVNRRAALQSVDLFIGSSKRKRGFDEPQDGTIIDVVMPLINLPFALTSYGHIISYVGNTFDKKYWNFSLDEQVDYDITATVEKVLDLSNSKKLIVFAHSSGGALTLMKLASAPEFAELFYDAVLLAPASRLGGAPQMDAICPAALGLNRLLGRERPIVPVFLPSVAQGLLQVLCNNKLTESTICPAINGMEAGQPGLQAVLTPTGLASLLTTSNLGEAAQLCQFSANNRTTYYDFGSEEANQIAYNQKTPPEYDLSKIKLRNMLFFGGNRDGQVTISNVGQTVSALKVPYEFIKLDAKGLRFNHVGYFTNRKLVQLFVVPTLKHLFRRRN